MSRSTNQCHSIGCEDRGNGGLITVLDTRIVTGAGGGPDKTILNSPRFLRGSKYRSLACYLRSPHDLGFSELRRRAAEKNCPLIEIDDAGPLSLVSSLKALADVCRRYDVQIWHGHDYKTNLLGVLLRPLFKFHLVTTVHGWVQQTVKTPFYYAIDRWTLPHHDKVVAVSHDLFDRCLRAGVRRKQLHLIENAIDTDEFQRTCPPAAMPSRSGLPSGRLVIGAAGRLSEEKGFDLLITAFVELVKDGNDLELWIAGEGPEREHLATQIANTGCAERIRLLGFQSNPKDFFGALDIFCLSSRREGLPNVVLEAMSMQIPVVATKCGGISAFCRDGHDMLTVPPGEVQPLADAVRTLLRDPDRRTALGFAGRQRVESDCSFRQRMERIIAVYDSLW